MVARDRWTTAEPGSQHCLDPYNLRYDRGSGAFDRRHIFNVNYVYDLPFSRHSGSYLERAVAGGWQISGVTQAETGSDLQGGGSNLTNGPDVIGLGGNTTNRPDIVAPVTYPHSQKAWFSKGSFAAPCRTLDRSWCGRHRIRQCG